ncbi:hypothetical protein [Undibacterium sp. TS12]|uniref:hypothetical protein n=1 Tax=Undibacterium sp. TS12 TaxID=2908202 RepID=UPI001F4CC611|nr:hypothetical protein [Undibacterium sp. TS12]MCH8621269.1 hypothetical protein [Undibacterium sp. TS12]
MAMNDWDGLAGNQEEGADSGSAQPARIEDEKKVVSLPAATAKGNNKTMYLAMGGLMLFVMGVFGYTKYMEIQAAQQDEQMQQQMAAKKKKEEAERKKRDAETSAKAAVAAPQEPAGASAPVAQTGQAVGDDLAALAQMKNKTSASASTVLPAQAATAQTTAPALAAAVTPPPLPARQTVPSAAQYGGQQATVTYPQDMQKRDQYVSLLESRVNELGLAKMRLEAELCKHEPKRTFCNQAGKGAGQNMVQPETIQTHVASRAPQTANEAAGRVMLFNTGSSGKSAPYDAQEPGRLAGRSGATQAATMTPRSAASSESTPSMATLQGLTVLRDRILYRDRDGLTHEVELGGEMNGMGRLEKIDFERKSFQAGGRTYN